MQWRQAKIMAKSASGQRMAGMASWHQQAAAKGAKTEIIENNQRRRKSTHGAAALAHHQA